MRARCTVIGLHFLTMWGLLLLLLTALALVIILLTAVLLWGSMHPPRQGPATALARGVPADPGDLGLQADEWWLDTRNGARLPVWDVDTGQNRSDRLTAVFIHGWAMSRYDMLARLSSVSGIVQSNCVVRPARTWRRHRAGQQDRA